MAEVCPRSRPRLFATALATALLVIAAPGVSMAQYDAPAGPTAADSTTRPARSESSGALTADLMYRLLIADIALQRGEPALAARAYYESAREAKDVSLARRATEISVATRQRALALEAAELWSTLDPAADRPKQVIAAAGRGASGGDVAEGDFKGQIERALAQAAGSPTALADAFLQINHLLGQEQDKAATYRLVVAVAEPYPNVPEAHFAVALAAYNTGLKDIGTLAAATGAIDRALVLKPGWERALLLKAEIIGKKSPAEAIGFLKGTLKTNPDMRAVWGALAELYIEPTNYPGAIIGGLVFGAGFVIGGYCPGTSLTACATGRLDGLAFIAGIFVASYAYAELFSRFDTWLAQSARADVTLVGLTGIPMGWWVAAFVAFLALAGWGMKAAERRFSGLRPGI